MQNKNNGHSVGFIYGDVGSTEFNFTVDDKNLKKFDYVTAPHKDGYVLAQVMDIKCHSDFKAEELKTVKTTGQLPSIHSELFGQASVIGLRDNKGTLQVPRTPFEIGSSIIEAEEDFIRHILGVQADKDSGAYIGLLKGHTLPVFLNIDTLVQKHICILAKTGGGKSYACGVLVEEMLKKKIPLVIIDTHGEYASLSNPNKEKKEQKNMSRFNVHPKDYSSQIQEYSPVDGRGKDVIHLTLNGMNLDAREIIDLLSAKLSGPQVGVLYQAVKEVKEYKQTYNLRDIIDTVNTSKSNAKWNVIASLESLETIGIFSDHATPMEEIVKKGRCCLLNMKGVPPDVQDVVVARLTKELFEKRKMGKIPPFLLIVEEAHNYCPEHGIGHAVSSSILRTIASEGRKFGMGLCIVSQRPAKVDKNVISQCNTNIILKITNPNDLKAVIASVEGLTSETYDEIQRLPIGVALISGASLQVPLFVEIRTRETSHGGKSVTVFKEDSEENYEAPKMPDMKELRPQPAPQESAPEGKPMKTPLPKSSVTDKARAVNRVAKRLGWVSTNDPDETIKILSKEAEQMKENVYQYLDSLAQLGQGFCHEADPNCLHCPMNSGCTFRHSHQGVSGKLGLFKRKQGNYA
ncbi:MAG: DUF87 domain-containing protein [Euryarchaeota archaeon]|nr:DUF87 domain-containing protein [Euryarchaeota archaeon]